MPSAQRGSSERCSTMRNMFTQSLQSPRSSLEDGASPVLQIDAHEGLDEALPGLPSGGDLCCQVDRSDAECALYVRNCCSHVFSFCSPSCS